MLMSWVVIFLSQLMNQLMTLLFLLATMTTVDPALLQSHLKNHNRHLLYSAVIRMAIVSLSLLQITLSFCAWCIY